MIVPIVWVLLFGLAINSENAAQAGRPVESFGDFKAAVEQTIDEVKARDSFVSYRLND